jgi:hypothetical protein
MDDTVKRFGSTNINFGGGRVWVFFSTGRQDLNRG